MSSIADSRAILAPDTVLPQHQAVLTVIKDRLENPSMSSFKWLDIACGRGQILTNIGNIISADCCRKVTYVGCDIIKDHCVQTEQLAEKHFTDHRVIVCDIGSISCYVKEDERFDAVTLTNTVHEITPSQMASTFVFALTRIHPDGMLYMYDMESLTEPELGAVPWMATEIDGILHEILDVVGVTEYRPTAATWNHRTCSGWHIMVNCQYLSVSAHDLLEKQKDMVDAATAIIKDMLEKKLLDLDKALTTASKVGAATEKERSEITRMTYEFWAINRALGGSTAIMG